MGSILLGLLGFLFAREADGAANRRRQDRALVASVTAGTCGLDQLHDAGRAHVASPTYSVEPPAGGDHEPVPAHAGTYAASVPRDGQLVHAMEHGSIAIWHQPQLSDDNLRLLGDIHRRYGRDVIVVPRSNLPAPVIATAWHVRLTCSAFEAESIDRFIVGYRNMGPERVPHPG